MDDPREVLTRLVLNLRDYASELAQETDMASLNHAEIKGKLESVSELCWLAHRVLSDSEREGR